MTTADPLVVLPSLDSGQCQRCLDSMSEEFRWRTVVVRNGGRQIAFAATRDNVLWPHNRGVAAAWNVGARRVIGGEHSHLVILSESVRFRIGGGDDFLDALDETDPDDEGWGCLGGLEFGWHLFAISRRMLETVGLFDESFFAFYEDTDWLYRAGLAGAPSPRENGRSWPYVEVDGTPGPFGANTNAPGVDMAAAALRYKQKWGGSQGREKYRTPFGLSERLLRSRTPWRSV